VLQVSESEAEALQMDIDIVGDGVGELEDLQVIDTGGDSGESLGRSFQSKF
jgi:hypothetical protein